MSSSAFSTTTSSTPPGLATPSLLAAAVPPPPPTTAPAPPPPVSSWVNTSIPPPPPLAAPSLAAWGEHYRAQTFYEHALAVIEGRKPTLALARYEVVEHWARLSETDPAAAANFASWWVFNGAVAGTGVTLHFAR